MIAPALPDLDLLRAFSAFARCLNFTRAARSLGVSQPALHAQVARLSDTLGLSLYVRDGRGLALTPDGVRVAGFARDLIDQTEGFLASVRGDDASRPVVLAAGEGSYLYLLGDAIRAYLQRPPAPLRLLTADRDAALAAVRAGTADLGVASLDARPTDLKVERLAEVAQVLAMPATHPLAERRSLKLKHLTGARMIVPPEGRAHRSALEEALRAQKIPWEVAVEASGWELMLRFVELGLGTAVVNGFCRLPKGVVARPVRDLPTRVFHLFSRRGSTPSVAQQTLAAALRARCVVSP